MTHQNAEIGLQVRLLASKVFMERDVGKSAEKGSWQSKVMLDLVINEEQPSTRG
jgi:hypothetical protein